MSQRIKDALIAISAITEGELMYGLARKPEAVRLRAGIEALLASVQILPWDSQAARAYGTLRAQLTAAGKTLSNMDMLIAAQAMATDAILVTRDAAFSQVEALHPVTNWATDL
jgi:tRNA(fMet)-specific endonuclease VapC